MSEKGLLATDLTFPELNDRQVRFVWGIVAGKPASRAYSDAGYKGKGNSAEANASRLLRKDKVHAALTRAREEVAERTCTDQDFVMDELRRVYERAMQITPVTNNKGEFLGEYQFQGNVANKALELMGKHIGMFNDKLEVSGGTEPVKMLTIVKTVRADEDERGRVH